MYKVISGFTLIIGVLFGTLIYSNSSSISDTIAFLPCIIVSFALLLVSVKEEYEAKLARRIYLAYILRFLIMLWNVYGREIYCLPGVGTDTEGFYHAGMMIGQDLSLLNQNLYGTYYSKYLGIIYSFTGPSYLLGSYLNYLYSIASISVLHRILLKVHDLGDDTMILFMSLFALEPVNMIIGSSLRRESLIIMFVIISLNYITEWIETRALSHWFLALGCVLLSSILHAGVIGIAFGYVILVLFYDIQDNCWKFQARSIAMGVIILLGAVVLITRYSNIFLSKIMFEDESQLIKSANRAVGGAAYLTNLRVNSVRDVLLYSPLKFLYFLASPIPLNWRGVSDIIAFFLDAIVYIYLAPRWIKSLTFAQKDPIVFSFGLSCLMSTIIYATGSQNSANAMRHRLKLLGLMIIVACLVKAYTNRQENSLANDE